VRYEIGIAGSGGQGIALMGTILADAAAQREDMFVAQTRSYDAAVTGGKTQSNLVISDEEIDYPGVVGFDLLLLFTQRGSETNTAKLKKDALLIVDADLVREGAWNRILRIPFTKIARERFNDARMANMIALGALTELCEYIPSSAVEDSVSARFRKHVLELNLSSFREGIEITKTQKFSFETVEEEDTKI
jgi:2-oxoglutarate ferredoxin oxidoreductase subunit gamma